MSQQTDSGLELSQTNNVLSHAVFSNKYLSFSLLKVSFCLASSSPILCQWKLCIFRSASSYMQYQPGSKIFLCCYFKPGCQRGAAQNVSLPMACEGCAGAALQRGSSGGNSCSARCGGPCDSQSPCWRQRRGQSCTRLRVGNEAPRTHTS